MKKLRVYGWLKGKRVIKAIALVDDEDYERVSQYKWRYDGRYIIRTRSVNDVRSGLCKTTSLHREVLNNPSYSVDHKDSNKLNCQKDNLRPATQQENIQNGSKRITFATSKYKGVSWDKSTRKWTASIRGEGKDRYLGSNTNEDEAALLYNSAAIKYFGKFAKLNIIET